MLCLSDERGRMGAIWRREQEEWRPLLASGFPSEEALHDLVEDAPQLLPLSGDPTLVVVGREVSLGAGWAGIWWRSNPMAAS
jgi:hypothetical protein